MPGTKKDTSDEKIIQLHALGLSDRQMAQKLGVDQSTANKRRRELNLPNNNTTKIRSAPTPESNPPPPVERLNPLALAKGALGARLTELDGQGYRLDGVPVGLTQIMQAYNRIRRTEGLPLILDNPLWRPQ